MCANSKVRYIRYYNILIYTRTDGVFDLTTMSLNSMVTFTRFIK